MDLLRLLPLRTSAFLRMLLRRKLHGSPHSRAIRLLRRSILSFSLLQLDPSTPGCMLSTVASPMSKAVIYLRSLGLGVSFDNAALLDFMDAGYDQILAADSSASDLFKGIAAEFGVDFGEDLEAVGINHTGYAFSEIDG